MNIGQVARATGLDVRTLRFYEQEGLLPHHPRTQAGYRIFSNDDVQRLEFIKQAKRLGLSLSEIKDILAITARGEATCEHVRAVLQAKVAEADQALRELRRFRNALADLLARAGPLVDCRPTGGRICAIIEQAPMVAVPSAVRGARRPRKSTPPGERHA